MATFWLIILPGAFMLSFLVLTQLADSTPVNLPAEVQLKPSELSEFHRVKRQMDMSMITTVLQDPAMMQMIIQNPQMVRDFISSQIKSSIPSMGSMGGSGGSDGGSKKKKKKSNKKSG